MRILVNQTTRMGDTLQTSPMIQELRNQYPDAHIAVMVRRMGRVIAEHHPAIDEVIVYDEDEMFVDMRARDSDRLLKAYELTDRRVQQLRAGHFDLALNMTHSIASAMFMKIVHPPNVIGAYLSDDWHFVLRGPWTTYFFTSVFSRDYNDLNLCDIMRGFVAGAPPCRKLVFEVRDEDRRFIDALFQEHNVGKDDFVVCMQLGASESGKRWSAECFGDLTRLLAERKNARVFLVGVTEEAPLGDVCLQHAPGLAVPLYGKTTVPQLAALLERSHALVTNDTGTMHIAAAVNCPITLVSVGNVHYRETGPYGEGHCAIEMRRRTLGRSDFVPGGLDERDQIAPEQVFDALELTLGNDPSQPVAQREETPELAKVDLFMTRFAPDGCLQFYPVIRRDATERDVTRMAYRAMWLDHFRPDYDKRAEQESLRLMLRHFNGPDAKTVQRWCNDLTKIFHQLTEIAQRGMRTTEKLLGVLEENKEFTRARQIVADLMAIDEECRIFSELHPACRPLVLIARFERDNLEEAAPLVLAQTTLEIYRACYARSRLIEQKLKRIKESL